MIEQFRTIATLLEAVGPQLDLASKYGEAEAVMIETQIIRAGGKVIARVWGPFKDADAAYDYTEAKLKRVDRLYYAHHFGKAGPGTVESDKDVYGHPDFAYRCISVRGYFARYLAQIHFAASTAMVEALTEADSQAPFFSAKQINDLEDDDGQ